jgi:hypothetical protein
MEWIGLIWLRIGTSGGLLWTRYWTFGFHKMLGDSRGAAQLTAPQEGLSSVSKWVFIYHIQLTIYLSEFYFTICARLYLYILPVFLTSVSFARFLFRVRTNFSYTWSHILHEHSIVSYLSPICIASSLPQGTTQFSMSIPLLKRFAQLYRFLHTNIPSWGLLLALYVSFLDRKLRKYFSKPLKIISCVCRVFLQWLYHI